jgi:threonine synthase
MQSDPRASRRRAACTILSRAGKPLLVRYDLAAVARALPREALRDRAPDWWRYRELLPMRRDASIVSLGEVMTPLIGLPRVAAELRLGDVIVKDEGRLPTGSFKARGLALAVTMAHEFGVREMAIPTNGNAGAAMAPTARAPESPATRSAPTTRRTSTCARSRRRVERYTKSTV